MDTTQKIIYVGFCVMFYELIKRKSDFGKIMLTTTFLLFIRQIFNNKPEKTRGISTIPGFLKMILIFLGACVILVPELYTHDLFRMLLYLNLLIMTILCVVDAKFKNNRWKPYVKLQIVPLIGLSYILYNFPKSIKLKNGLITHVSDMKHWLILQSIVLSILYTQSDIFKHERFASLVTVVLPFLYSLKAYYSVRAVSLIFMLFTYLI